MEWFGLAVVALVIIWFVFVVYTSIRDSKKVIIDSEFALRLLSREGRPLPLTEGWVNDDEEGFSKHWEVFTSRPFTQTDARIAYESYQLIRAGAFDQLPLTDYVRSLLEPEELNSYMLQYYPEYLVQVGALVENNTVRNMAKRYKFTSLSSFINHVAFFDSTLLDTLRQREVDASEYELDKSGWDDEDED